MSDEEFVRHRVPRPDEREGELTSPFERVEQMMDEEDDVRTEAGALLAGYALDRA